MIVGAFSFFYVFITNTKVRIASAFAGGLTAGVMWQVTGLVFAAVVVNSAKYAAIYSAFATLIVFMIWLYVSWLILLIGASVAFYHQNPAYRAEERGELHVSNRLKERIALHVMHLVGRSYYQGAKPWTDEGLTRALHMPMEAVQDVLEALERSGLLRHTDDEPPAYLPGKPPETTPVFEALAAVRTAGERIHLALDRLPHRAAVSSLVDHVDEAVEQALQGRTLKDLALMDSDTVTRLPGGAARPGDDQAAGRSAP
jgi:membrane protein